MGNLSKVAWFQSVRRVYNALCRARLASARLDASAPEARRATDRPKILVLGIYLADRPNTAAHLVHRFAAAEGLEVRQAWAAVGLDARRAARGGGAPDEALGAVTVLRLSGFVPKFSVLNRLIAREDWKSFDYLVFSDDDIVMPHGFLDAYLGLQIEFDLALAQPARTRNSYADRKFCLQAKRIRGRRTRYVEIGPLFSVRRDLAPLLLPFDESSPMGWGYDYVWPVIVEESGRSLGIIDATPVDHSLRPQALTYSASESALAMNRYLAGRKHLSKQEAFTVTRTFELLP